MKNAINILLCVLLSLQLFGQIPSLQIQDPMGNFFNLPDYLENDKNYGLIIWSAQDPPSTAALDDYYADWVSTYNLEFLIISIDEQLSQEAVNDYVNQQGWDYTLFFSPIDDVTQAFGINQIPYIYLINTSHQIIFETAGWMQGNLLDEEISQLITVGLDEHSALDHLRVYSLDNSVIIDMEPVSSSLRVSIFTLDGKAFFQNSYSNPTSNRLQVDTSTLPLGTIVVVKVEDSNGAFTARKIMIQ